MTDCSVSGCIRSADREDDGRGGVCAMHRKRLKRGKPLCDIPEEKLSRYERVVEAVQRVASCRLPSEVLLGGLAYVDADSDNDAQFTRAVENLRVVLDRWFDAETARRPNSVPRAVDAGRRGGCEQRASSTPDARTPVGQGQVRKPERRPEVGPRNARPGRQPRADGDRATRAVDSAEKAPERRVRSGAGVARPCGVEADQLRAGSRRGAR